MKKLLLVALIASSFMSLQSCGGDDNVAPSGGGNVTTANLPIKIITGDDVIEFKYNSDDRLTQITKKRKGSLYEKRILCILVTH